MTIEEKKTKLDELVAGLATDLADEVKRIEARPETTQNHYGDYGALLGTVAKDMTTAKIIALALMKAGANRAGVIAGLKMAHNIDIV